MIKRQGIRTFWARVKEALQDQARAGKAFRGEKIRPTQKVAAKIAQVQQPSVSDWNKEGKAPELPNAIRLALELDVCVEWLYTERGPKRPGLPLDQHAQRLWELWPGLSEELKINLVGYVALKVSGIEQSGSNHPFATGTAARDRSKSVP